MSRKYEVADLKAAAAKHGGKCLSTAYRRSDDKYQWQCARGHRWVAQFNHILHEGVWCPECAGNKRSTIKQIKIIAKDKGGRCLSKQYVNAKQKLLFECAEGHKWKANSNNIQQGKWCPQCAIKRNAEKQKLKLSDLQEYAASHNGQLLSEKYTNCNTKLQWRCSKGHEWLSTAGSTYLNKSWCPKCGHEDGAAKRRAPGRLDDLKSLAISRGGQCLSNDYQSMHHLLKWKCGNGHRWNANPSDIRRGGWCPECASGFGERICRAYFEQLFSTKFPKSYPKWLVTKSGSKLELDGYSSKLKLAFEHQGAQHYKITVPMIPDAASLRKRKKVDAEKRKLCLENDVQLIEIWNVPEKTKVQDIRKVIKTECAKRNISLPHDFDTRQIQLKSAYSYSILRELQKIAVHRGGQLISKSFTRWNNKLTWECSEKHRWRSTPSSVKHQKTWCPVCRGVARYTISDMRLLAEQHSGKCLSKKYQGMFHHLIWQCRIGHKWKAQPTNIKSGHWCPECVGQKRGTIQEMRQIAAERGGKCLSKRYVNSKTKLTWQCAKNHIWEAISANVKNKGSWCPECAGKKPSTIEAMRKLATTRGGKCLSNEYVDMISKLKWRCKEGHIWKTSPNNIKNKRSWCPVCAKLRKK